MVETVRRNRILSGWPFPKADESARALVNAALGQIGAVRPKWADSAYRFATSERRVCPSCHEPFVQIFGIGSERLGGHTQKFCSFSCLRRSRIDARPIRLCEHCNNPFRAAPARPQFGEAEQRFCSQSCYRAHHAAEVHACRVCKGCGTDFTPRLGSTFKAQKYCSRDCWLEYHRPHQPRPCEQCGAEFQPLPEKRGENQRFCSRTCLGHSRRGTKIEGTGNPPKHCLQCGDSFQPLHGKQGERQRFCNRACSARWRNGHASIFTCERV